MGPLCALVRAIPCSLREKLAVRALSHSLQSRIGVAFASFQTDLASSNVVLGFPLFFRRFERKSGTYVQSFNGASMGAVGRQSGHDVERCLRDARREVSWISSALLFHTNAAWTTQLACCVCVV